MAGTAAPAKNSSVDRLAMIPVNKIRENEVRLREVNRDTEEYQGLVDSVKEKGILNPILVRELVDPESQEDLYGLIDGLHRFSAAQDAGLTEIPAHIRNMEAAELEEAQIVANVHRIETKPVEYTKQLVRLMARNPLMTTSELAKKLAKSTEWLYQRFSLTKLDEKMADLVDEGRIKLSNAYQLAKLPAEEQINFVENAMTMDPGEFTGIISSRLKELREARKQGRAAKPHEFQPVPHARKWSEIKQEFETPTVAKQICEAAGAKSPEDGFFAGIAWCAQMDPISKQAQIDKHEASVKKNEEDKKKRELDRAEKRRQEAAERVEKLKGETPEPVAQ